MAQEGAEEKPESKSSFMPIVIALGVTILLVGITVIYIPNAIVIGGPLAIVGLIVLALGLLNVFRQDAEEKFSESSEHIEKWPFGHLPKEKVGVWVFLTSEILLFGGLLVAYGYVRAQSSSWPDPLQTHSATIGMANTIILLTSSMLMILALYFIRNGNTTGAKGALAGTFVLGFTFLEIKLGFEWPAEIRQGFTVNSGMPASTYYTLTGVHAMHVAVGLVAVGYLMFRAFSGQFTKTKHTAVENVGLYWHFVDIVWMFLFTLFYLV